MDRITVWFLIGDLSVGGAEQTLLDLAGGLNEDQFDVTIWTIDDSGPLRDEIPEHVQYRSLDAAGKWDLRVPVRFVRSVRTETPDIIQSFLFFDNVLARLAAVTTSEPTVITGVRNVPNDRPIFRHVVDRLTVNLADIIVSNSKAGREFVIDHGAKPSKVEVIYNGRDLNKYAEGKATEELYRELGLEKDKPIIGTVGRLLERKGHFDLIEAWPQVQTVHPDAQLLIVGEGPAADSLQEKAVELGCIDSVYLPGRRDDIPDILDLVDIFVFPSHFEGLPGALLEAMAAGLPIVTTPVDGNKELVSDGEHGIHVPSKDSKKLAEAIDHFLSDHDYADILGKKAEIRAGTEFSLEQMTRKFKDIYEQTPDTQDIFNHEDSRKSNGREQKNN